MHINTVWVVVGLVSSVLAQVDQQPTAERRVAQNGNGTFFQPFINGINTFFNPSQFRNPLNQFRNPPRQQQQQSQQQQSQQQFSSQQFPPQTQQRQPSQQQPQFNQQQFGASQQQFNFQDFRNNPTFQQDFQITRFPQGSVTSEEQFSFVPRQQQQPSQPQFQQVQPAQQTQSNRFNPGSPGFASPSVRPFTDNVPTVPAVTSFDRFRPSEATDNSFRFQPSQRPEESNSQENSNSAIFPPRLQVEQATFPNSHTVRVPPTFSLRPDVATSPSVEPVSISGIINRSPVIPTSEIESTGTAFRGRKRLRPRFESSETGGRSRVRSKVKISVLEEKDEDDEENDTVPPTTSSRGRLRSRFSGSSPRSLVSKAESRPRVPTGPRIVPTGKRRRQKFGKSQNEEENNEDIENNNVPEEEDRRSDTSAPRRKLNRLPGQFTSRRKTTNPTEVPITRIPLRRRLRPLSFGNDQETIDFETESPQIFIDEDEDSSFETFPTTNKNGISVLPISTFGELEHHALHAHVQAAGVDDESEPVPSTAPPPSIFFDGFRVSPAVPIIQVCLFT